MRVVVAWLIVLVTFASSAIASAIWGSHRVAPHVRFETSCMLLDAGEKEGWLSRSERFDVIQKITASQEISLAVREAADQMRAGCPRSKIL